MHLLIQEEGIGIIFMIALLYCASFFKERLLLLLLVIIIIIIIITTITIILINITSSNFLLFFYSSSLRAQKVYIKKIFPLEGTHFMFTVYYKLLLYKLYSENIT